MTGLVLEGAMPSVQFALKSPNSVLQCGRIQGRALTNTPARLPVPVSLCGGNAPGTSGAFI
jgi:hypothetical protein